MSIHKAANHSKNQQDMQEHLILWQSFIKDSDTAYHCNKVKKLAEERRYDFPQHGQNVCKDFQSLYLIQRCRKQPL